MQDIHPIKPMIELSILTHGQIIFLVVILCIVGLISIVLIAYFLHKRIVKKRQNIIDAQPVKDDIDYLLDILRRMEKVKKKIELGDYKNFHLEVAIIARYFLFRKYNINAVDMTSTELNKNQAIPKKINKHLEEFFFINDLAKFAKINFNNETAYKVYDLGIKIIKL